MEIKFPSLTSIIRYAKWVILAAMVLGIAGVCWFLYRYFYQPITQAAVVAELKERVALITVKTKALDNVLATIEKYDDLPNVKWQDVRDVFVASPIITPPPQTPAPEPLSDVQPTPAP